MKLHVTRIDNTMPMPKYETSGAVAFDMYAREETTIAPKEIGLVPTNFVVCVPDGHMLMLASRSSTPQKKGLMVANGVGVIDQDYCGPGDEIKAIMYNWTDEPITVDKGVKFVQGLVIPILRCELVETPFQTDVNRGGIGSTG